MSKQGDLTAKQQLFIDEYLKCYNATQAAKLAGYKGNENVLGVTGYDNLRNPKIAEVIQKRLQESAMSADETLGRLADMARADMRDFIKSFEIGEKTVAMVDLGKALDENKTHLIKKLKYNAQGGLEIELHDSQSALEKIGRHHGLFTDKIELKLEKEMDAVLEIAEKALDADNYQRLLQAITGYSAGSSEAPEPGESN